MGVHVATYFCRGNVESLMYWQNTFCNLLFCHQSVSHAGFWRVCVTRRLPNTAKLILWYFIKFVQPCKCLVVLSLNYLNEIKGAWLDTICPLKVTIIKQLGMSFF